MNACAYAETSVASGYDGSESRKQIAAFFLIRRNRRIRAIFFFAQMATLRHSDSVPVAHGEGTPRGAGAGARARGGRRHEERSERGEDRAPEPRHARVHDVLPQRPRRLELYRILII